MKTIHWIGTVVLAALVSAVVAIAWPAITKQFEDSQGAARKERDPALVKTLKSWSNLRQVGWALQIYGDSHQGRYPSDPKALVNDVDGLSSDTLECPRPGYHYVYRFPRTEPRPLQVVAWEEGSGDEYFVGLLLADNTLLTTSPNASQVIIARGEATDDEKRAR